jgi:hypothetical protein
MKTFLCSTPRSPSWSLMTFPGAWAVLGAGEPHREHRDILRAFRKRMREGTAELGTAGHHGRLQRSRDRGHCHWVGCLSFQSVGVRISSQQAPRHKPIGKALFICILTLTAPAISTAMASLIPSPFQVFRT